MSSTILAIDQGTTSTRSIIFQSDQTIAAVAQREFTQHYPQSGWVEHDPKDILDTTITTAKEAILQAGLMASDIAAIGITNQRETIVVWDRQTGKPIHFAIVWQDRRTARFCEDLKKEGLEPLFTEKTGLLLDPYFSATKLAWLLETIEGARQKAEAGQLLFGTIDTYLIWHLTGGKRHVSDATNASRTLLYNIHENRWDDELLSILKIPRSMLPEVLDSSDNFGVCETSLFGAPIPIHGVAGDQQAALIGQACFMPGMVKSTYGTGCFMLMNTGVKPIASSNNLLTTIAYRLDGQISYAIEGAIFIAGAGVQWLRDGLKIIETAEQSNELAQLADKAQSVYLVPAFVGLGAPYWNANVRGALFGLTRNCGPAEIARATLEAVAYQTFDLIDAMKMDWQGDTETVIRVDGGMSASNWTMQCLANILNAPVDRSAILETTALGAAWLAARKIGLWPNEREFSQSWQYDRRFEPMMEEEERQRKISGWKTAIAATLTTENIGI